MWMWFFTILLAAGYLLLLRKEHRMRKARKAMKEWQNLCGAIIAHLRDGDFTARDWHELLLICRKVDQQCGASIRPFTNDSCEMFVLSILYKLQVNPKNA